jgi:hypothetical protein
MTDSRFAQIRTKVIALLDPHEGHPDGREVTVVCGQRDYAAYAAHTNRPIKEADDLLLSRWATWHAGKRAMVWSHDFEAWDALCEAVLPAAEVEPAHPTDGAPTDGSSPS